uniref:hypothetical protein n=1 Tax=Kitasatospora sp. NPDC088134 TaxID=3364071 RepID=UPI003825BE4F
MRDPNGPGVAEVDSDPDHLDGSCTTTPIRSNCTNPSGSRYTSEPCSTSRIFGDNHNFNNGARGSGNHGDR